LSFPLKSGLLNAPYLLSKTHFQSLILYFSLHFIFYQFEIIKITI